MLYLLKRFLQVRKIDGILWCCNKIINQQLTDLYAFNYKEEENRSKLTRIRELLNVCSLTSNDFVNCIRVGRDNDGGYVMIDDFESIDAAYGFGICDDVSWELFFAKRGIDVYMYDHTIKRLPRRNKRFHWKKLGVCSRSGICADMNTLEYFVKENVHGGGNLILKMDIEGCEWDVFSDAPTEILALFDQIVCEFHGLFRVEKLDRIIETLERINETHQLIHVHANNNCSVLKLEEFFMPELLEVTYVRRKGRSFDRSEAFFPTCVDQRNSCFGGDIPLGKWNL